MGSRRLKAEDSTGVAACEASRVVDDGGMSAVKTVSTKNPALQGIIHGDGTTRPPYSTPAMGCVGLVN